MNALPIRSVTSLSLLLAFACSNPPEADYGDDGAGGAHAGTTSTAGTGSSSGGTGTITGGGSGGIGVITGGAAGTATAGSTGSAGGSALSGVLGHPSTTVTYPTYSGFTLTMAEEFDAPIDLVADPIWTYSDGGLPEGNVRFVKDAIKFEGGMMKITVSSQSQPTGESYAENGTVFSKPLSSGEFRSKFNNFRYGRYEVRMKAPYPAGTPGVNGNFINTMFVFRTPKFQDWREIDIEVTGDSSTSLTTNVIYGDNQQSWMPSMQEAMNPSPPAGFDSRADFHTYAFEWTPTQVKWFIDGTQIRSKDSGVGPNNILVPDKSTKIMMNLWIFPSNGFGCDPSTNAYPFTAEYDWFRFYKLDTETTYPCSPTPACLSADDIDQSKNNPEDGL